jgi:hypothetical protein
MIDYIHMEGALLISCAGPARGPHGVKYYKDSNTGGEALEYHPCGPLTDYYCNIHSELLLFEILTISGFRKIIYHADRSGQDLNVACIGKFRTQINYNRGELANLRKRKLSKL